jgi:hypothetical protein
MADTFHPADIDHPSTDNTRRASEDRRGDFFTRLAERALGVAPLAQPVIAPVYAPDPGISVEAGAAQIPALSARAVLDDPLLLERYEWAETPQVSADPDRSAAASIPAVAVRSPRKGLAPEAPRAVQTRQELAPDSGNEVPATPAQPVRPTQATVVRIQPDAVSARPGLTGIQPALQPVSPEPGTLPVSSPRSAALSADVSGMGDETRRVDEYNSSVRSSFVERHAADQPREPAGIALQQPTDELVPRLLVPLLEQPVSQAEGSPTTQARRASPDRDSRPDTLASRRSPRTPANLPERRLSSLVVQPILAEPEAAEQQPTDDLYPPHELYPPDELYPPIRITIGRVEVRAVQPPPTAPARPASRKAPALSLDDYLKQRNEVRR